MTFGVWCADCSSRGWHLSNLLLAGVLVRGNQQQLAGGLFLEFADLCQNRELSHGMNEMEKPVPTVFLLSGGTGRTCEIILRAALAQFSNPEVEVRRFFHLNDAQRAIAIVQQAARENALLIHTIVEPTVREAVEHAINELRVQAVDPLGPTIAALADRLDTAPAGKPGLLYALAKEQFDRIDAVDFTLAHDDGQRMEDLDQADVVLVGVSRVSKSVTCFYLAARGIRAANVPLAPPIAIPSELERLPPERIIGLTMQPARLVAIRRQRLERLRAKHVDAYVDLREVAREVHDAEREYARRGWHCIDVSYKAVEEVASEIIAHLRRRNTSDDR